MSTSGVRKNLGSIINSNCSFVVRPFFALNLLFQAMYSVGMLILFFRNFDEWARFEREI